MSSFSIVIPAYNEEKAIGALLGSIHGLRLGCELIVVDDASTDDTAEIAAQHGARVLRHPINCGYGKSVKDGVCFASHDIIVIIDADGTYPITSIPVLVQEFERGCDMVVGARHGKEYRGTFLKMPARYVFKLLVEFTTGRRIPDINSGFRVFSKQTVQRYFSDICNGFSFTTTITLIYLLTGKIVSYVPVDYGKRIGRSKVKIIRDTFRTLQYVTECIVRYNPLKLFILLSLMAMIVGAVGASIEPSMFFVGLLTAILIFSLGCIADSVRSHSH